MSKILQIRTFSSLRRFVITSEAIIIKPISIKVPVSCHQQIRLFSKSKIFKQQSAAEEQMIKILADSFPGATDIAVVDVSGGCGSMYEVHVEAPDFKNMRIVKQHQLVTKALAKEIKDMHGIRISTSASKTCGEK